MSGADAHEEAESSALRGMPTYDGTPGISYRGKKKQFMRYFVMKCMRSGTHQQR